VGAGGAKANLPGRLGRQSRQLANGVEEGLEPLIMTLEATLDLCELTGERLA